MKVLLPSMRLMTQMRRTALCVTAVLLLAATLLGTPAADAQSDAPDEVVIFVLDLSGSMNEPFDAGRTKLDAAKAAFAEAFANVSPDALVGLRTYGDQLEPTTPENREASCTTDSRLATPVAPLQSQEIINQVQGFTARGDTPIGLALQSASGDVPRGAIATIVLFSDGRDECHDADLDGDPSVGASYGQNPCDIAKDIASTGSVERVVTVGFRADAAAERELRCIAESTGGAYTSIETPADARDVLPELLVQLSAPREAKLLLGQEINGTPDADGAPELFRLDTLGVEQALYTDRISVGQEKWYHVTEYGPEGGTFTATVFGLPAEEGLNFDMRLVAPGLNNRTFFRDHGDANAGLPARPSASIRCTACLIPEGPHEAYWVVSLASDTESTESYPLEIVTAGPGFGGPSTSCSEPQECWYPQEILDRTEALAELEAAIVNNSGEQASAELIQERDDLAARSNQSQDAKTVAEERAIVLEERIAMAPLVRSSYKIPMLMVLMGIVLAFAPWKRLKNRRSDEDETSEDGDGNGEKVFTEADADAPDVDVATIAAQTASAGGVAATAQDGPPEVGLPLATSGTGHNWEEELAAAKAAVAGQSPEESRITASLPPERQRELDAAAHELASESAQFDPTAERHAAAQMAARPQFTAEQHAAARAAAEKIAAQRAASEQTEKEPPSTVERMAAKRSEAEAAAAADRVSQEPESQEEPTGSIALGSPEPEEPSQPIALGSPEPEEPSQPIALGSPEPEEPSQPIALGSPEPEEPSQPMALGSPEPDERSEISSATVEPATTAAFGEQEATRLEAEAQPATNEQAASKQAAAEQVVSERAAAEKAASERAAAASRAAAGRAAAARETAERAAAAEQAAAEQAAAEKAAAEQAAAEQAAAEQAAAQQAAAEQAAAEKAAAEKAAREAAAQQAAAEQAAAEQAAAQQAAAEQAAAEQAAREAAAQRAAAEQAAAQQAAAEQAAAEQAAREAAAQRAAAEQAAAEQAAREAAAQRAAAEKAAAEAAQQRAAAEKAAHEAAAQAAADRAAAEKAAAEAALQRAAAEKTAREAAAQAAADRAAAEKAAAEAVAQRAAAERAAAEAAQQAAADRAAAELAARQAVAAEAASAGSQEPAPAAPKPPTVEEAREQARQRMFAKQNIHASSSSGPVTAHAPRDTAGTAAALRPVTSLTTADPSAASQPATRPTGWYEDPAIVGQFRWWDGKQWTSDTTTEIPGAQS